MFAVIKTGGKQYRVASGDVIKIEKLDGEAGSSLDFDDVLLVGDDSKVTTGTPIVKGAKVSGEILEQTRADKVLIFKKKRRQNYRRKAGHRQNLTVVRITDIAVGAKKKAAAKKAAVPAEDAAAEE
jgi:large subunit ribosomal protein L21